MTQDAPHPVFAKQVWFDEIIDVTRVLWKYARIVARDYLEIAFQLEGKSNG